MSKVRQALAPDEVATYKKLEGRLMGRLWGYIRPYRFTVLWTLLLSIGSGLLRLTQPLLAKRIIDVEIARGDFLGIMRMSAVFLCIIVFAVVMDILFNYYTAAVGQRSMHDLRTQLFRHILSQDVVFFDRNPVGRLITRLTSDIGTLNDLFATGVVAVMGEMLIIVGVLALMLVFNLRLTLVVLVSAPFILLVVGLFRRQARKWYLETRRTLATMNAYLQENVAGVRTVQSFNREAKNHRQFVYFDNDFRFANIKTVFAYAFFFPAMSFISSMAVAGVIWVGGRQLLLGRELGLQTLTFGELFLFVQAVSMLFNPIRNLSEKYNLVQSAMASSERIFMLLDTHPKIVPPPAPRPVGPLREGIRFEDVHFEYVAGEPVLRGVSFELAKGRTVAVVGATGAGKSTLINLMTRFYDVTGGRITRDGTDLRQLDLAALRRTFAVVLQEVFLFSGTIAENLRLANPALTDEQLWEILRQVGADDFVASRPGGLQAEVTERGGGFSTGQKQLLAFARALASDPEVLVLDEATANIDTATEHRIQEAIRRMLAGRTALVIAHRLSTIQRADMILVMHHGKIHEAGTHEELLQRDGLYRRLYELQYRREAEVG